MLDRLPQTILESVTTIPLPPLPQVLVRFLTLVNDDSTPMKDLATLVAQDPAFTAQLLTIATSPPYRLEAAVLSLEQSMASLGMPLLRIVASCMAVQNDHLQAVYERNFDYAGFWCHSLRVAALARSLAAAVGYENLEEAYLAGLLHDIGQLLVVGGVGEFCGLCPGERGPETGAAGLAQSLSNIDHIKVGARLLDSWKLSSFMADAVLFHQFPVEQIGSADLLCRIVWSAHRFSGFAEDIEISFERYHDIRKIPAFLGIDLAAIVKACQQPQAWVEERALFFGVQNHRQEEVFPESRFIYPHVSLPKRYSRNAAQLHLDALVRNQAVMQPLQQSLTAHSKEADLYATLREIAGVLFGLSRPVFLVPHPDRPVLVVAASAGQPPLLNKLEIPLDPGQSLASLSLQTWQSCSSFDDAEEPVALLSDIQLARLLGGQGLLCIPMGSGMQQPGVMVFGLTKEQHAGKRRLLDWMASFAQLAAKSLETFHSLRQRDQRVTADLTRRYDQKARKVIHEALNPLGIINNYLNIFAGKLGNTADLQQELTILREEIFRVESIVRRLNYLPEQSLSVETVNVNALIEGMLALYGESLFESRGIDIEKQLAPGNPSVKADRDSLKQILLNLWKNSAEAMPAGGSFRISTWDKGQDIAGGNVEIRLSDSGPGIPPDVMELLFKPLPSDRRPANSGVGLSIVASLVKKLGGQIACDSSPGKGTIFTIKLAQVQKEFP